MATKTTSLLLLILLLSAGVALASPGDSTHGHGTASTVGSFVFDAKETGSGTVTGKVRFGTLSIDIDVNCLIISGNTAIIGGTDVVSPSTTYAFKVTDNGGGATADRITLPQVGQTCATFNTLGSFALTSGDIEVHDLP
ncbi:MAG TPA: hypothetical protein VF173_06275 [Thermoanaerobaculia bacterium]|nr:hypothetical protein [Thermoanaerobaculia bacterium]